MSRSRLIITLVAGIVTVAACTADQGVSSTEARPSGSSAPDTTAPGDTSPDATEPNGTDPDPTSSAPPTTDGPTIGALDWGACTDEAATDEALQCATLTVPLDYDDPSGETLDLALVRVPADDPDDRIGAILFNPGGPGGSGFEYIAQAGSTIVGEMGLEDFDLIGFDPRGVDRSNGLRCLDDAEFDAQIYLDDTPDTPEEEAALEAADDAWVQGCLDRYGDTLVHYGTENVARDMDAMRAALGDEQLSYIGISYGTYLGSVYATMFPDRVRALVLDSAYEPTGDSVEQQYTTQLVGFDTAFANWAAWCEAEASCAFRADDVPAAWDQLVIDLDATPAPASDGRLANDTVMRTATSSALYAESQWPLLASALAEARDGAGDKLFVLADGLAGRNPDGSYVTLQQSFPLITCASGLGDEVPDDPAALAERMRELSPRFAADVSADDFEDSCAELMPAVTPPTLDYAGDAPILVVGGLEDPATPFRWAEEMTDAMGPSARLLTYTGEGHGQLLNSTCVTEFEAATLVDLELPDEGAVCEPDPDVPEPDWWTSLPVPDGVSDVIDSSGSDALLGITPSLAFSESRTTDLSPDDALDAYDAALEALGWIVGDRAEPIDGVPQGVYFDDSGAVFSVLAIGPEAFENPDLDGLDQVADPTRTLLVLLAF
ncbi:MAG: alpha/beta fold hydrolase [Acidimicrobiales bacterium]|nr:alpha/beta fold hydrolase [Acidimicrobiales bacterium]